MSDTDKVRTSLDQGKRFAAEHVDMTAVSLGKRFAHHPTAMGADWAQWVLAIHGALTVVEFWRTFDGPANQIASHVFGLAYPEHGHDDKRADRFWLDVVGIPTEAVDAAFLIRFLIAAVDEWAETHGPIDLNRYMFDAKS